MKRTQSNPNDATLTIHRKGYPNDTVHFNLPVIRQELHPATLQAIAEDIANGRCEGCNYNLRAVANADGSFTLE